MVAPEADDGVVLLGGLFPRVDEPADLVVAISDGGQIGLHGFLPSAGLQHRRVIARRLGDLRSGGRHVREVTFDVRRELDLVQGKKVEPLLGYVPRHVRLHEAGGDEPRLLMLLRHLLDAPADDGVVRHLLVRARQGRELDAADAVILGIGMQLHGAALAREIFVEMSAPIPGAMVDLAGPEDGIAVLGEMAVEQLVLADPGTPVLVVLIAAGAARAKTRHQRGPRRIAGRRGAIGLRETDAHLRKSVDVRGLGLDVTTEETDPVVEVVDGNEEDIRLLGRFGGGQGGEGQKPEA